MARPKGSKNQKTIEWDEFGRMLTEQGIKRVAAILETCDDETFIRTYVQLLEYFKPKMKRLEVRDHESSPVEIRVVRTGGPTSWHTSESE
jgi:hypothetical protein